MRSKRPRRNRAAANRQPIDALLLVYTNAGVWILCQISSLMPLNLKTIISIRYEQLDLNDLNPADSNRFSGSLAYQLKGLDELVKLQYFNNLNEQESLDPLD